MAFFPTITMEISTFHFRTSMAQGGNLSKFSIHFHGTYESGDYWYNHVMWYFNLHVLCFFPTKMMGIITFDFGNYVGKYWYLISLYILIWNRSAAAQRCACFFVFTIVLKKCKELSKRNSVEILHVPLTKELIYCDNIQLFGSQHLLDTEIEVEFSLIQTLGNRYLY